MSVPKRSILLLAVVSIVTSCIVAGSASANSATTTKTQAKFTWGIVTGTHYFNRLETKQVAVGGGTLAGIAVFIPPPFDAVIGVIGVGVGSVAAWADTEGKCLKLKSTGIIGIYGPKDKNGRYCK